MQHVGLVGAAHLAALQIIKQLVDHEFDLANHHGVAMLERFLRHEARMDAAHDDRHAARPKRIRDLVAAIDVARHCRDADEIGFEVEVDRLNVLISQNHLVTIPRHCGCHRKQTCER